MRPSRPTLELDDTHWSIQVTDDQSRTLIDAEQGVAFHSASGGFAETKHVYLENSGVSERLLARKPTTVLEIGLGLGMGCLLTLDAAATANCELRYTAIENEWLTAAILRKLNFGELLKRPSLADEFLHWRESLGRSVPEGAFQRSFGSQLQVVVEHGDAKEWYPENTQRFDAIYFDPFAPDVNPDLWTSDFLARMRSVLTDDGAVVTYCVSRRVRETFVSAGFDVERLPGPPGGKREVLRAVKSVRA